MNDQHYTIFAALRIMDQNYRFPSLAILLNDLTILSPTGTPFPLQRQLQYILFRKQSLSSRQISLLIPQPPKRGFCKTIQYSIPFFKTPSSRHLTVEPLNRILIPSSTYFKTSISILFFTRTKMHRDSVSLSMPGFQVLPILATSDMEKHIMVRLLYRLLKRNLQYTSMPNNFIESCDVVRLDSH
jgi:hypothetical protein